MLYLEWILVLMLVTSGPISPERPESFDRIGLAARPDSANPGAPLPWLWKDPADSLYRAAREALNRREYRPAARLFGEIPNRFPRSGYAADALYWNAFALY